MVFYNRLSAGNRHRLKDAQQHAVYAGARNRSNDWQKYNIKQNGDDFVLTPKNGGGNLKQFTINVGRRRTIINSAR